MRDRFRRRPTVLWRRSAGGIVVVAPAGDVVTLTPPAEVLWAALAEPMTVADLTTEAVKTFAVNDEVARADILRFVAELEQHSLLETCANG